MAKPFRSPLVGYNHNISHLGRVFHVQSEDSGPAAPRLFTHLFFEGTILVSRKCEYEAALPDDRVRALMQAQHKAVIKELMQSRLDDRIVAFFASRGEDLLPLLQARAAAVAAATAAAAVAGGGGAVRPADPMPGAVPQAAVRETPEPVMVLTDVSGIDMAAATAAAGAADPDAAGADAVSGAGARRRTAAYQRESSPGAPAIMAAPPIVAVGAPAHPSEPQRPPFVRSGNPGVARVSSGSADGVVVQRSVVVGGGGSSPSRPTRIRPPIPYVVTGGGHTERPPKPLPSPLAPLSGVTGVPVVLPAAAPTAQVSAVEGQSRPTGAFGVPIGDDKSLDEVILEYLSDDGEP